MSLSIHIEQWLSSPIEHVKYLNNSQFGLYHPLYFTFGAYFIVAVFRGLVALIDRLFRGIE